MQQDHRIKVGHLSIKQILECDIGRYCGILNFYSSLQDMGLHILFQKPGHDNNGILNESDIKKVSCDERWDWKASFCHNRACIHLLNEQP